MSALNRRKLAVVTALEQLGGAATTRSLAARAQAIEDLGRPDNKPVFFGSTRAYGRRGKQMLEGFYKALNSLISERVLIRGPRTFVLFHDEYTAAALRGRR